MPCPTSMKYIVVTAVLMGASLVAMPATARFMNNMNGSIATPQSTEASAAVFRSMAQICNALDLLERASSNDDVNKILNQAGEGLASARSSFDTISKSPLGDRPLSFDAFPKDRMGQLAELVQSYDNPVPTPPATIRDALHLATVSIDRLEGALKKFEASPSIDTYHELRYELSGTLAVGEYMSILMN